MNDTTKYTATFVLSQTGIDGEISAKLKFEPLVDITTVDEDEQPGVFEIMSHLTEQFLYLTGVVDEHGDLIDPEAFHSGVTLDTTDFNGGGNKQLN